MFLAAVFGGMGSETRRLTFEDKMPLFCTALNGSVNWLWSVARMTTL